MKRALLTVMLIIGIKYLHAQQRVIEYYPNGKIKYKGYVINNTFDSTFISYYENGNKKKEGTYKSCSYNIDSVIIFIMGCGGTGQRDTCKPKEGVTNGTWKYYYENGNIMSISNYYCGISNGLQQYFDSLGRITRSEFESADGAGIIERRYYYPNGNIQEYDVLLNSYSVLDEDERTDTVNEYYRTVRVEQVLLYYETGELKESKTVDEYLLSLKYTKYWKNGFKKEEGEYIRGMKNGVFKEYFETGYKKSEKIYKNDVEE